MICAQSEGQRPPDLRKHVPEVGLEPHSSPCKQRELPKTCRVRPSPAPVRPSPTARVCTLCTPSFDGFGSIVPRGETRRYTVCRGFGRSLASLAEPSESGWDSRTPTSCRRRYCIHWSRIRAWLNVVITRCPPRRGDRNFLARLDRGAAPGTTHGWFTLSSLAEHRPRFDSTCSQIRIAKGPNHVRMPH